MANSTIYPYGAGGSLPSSIGIINDLESGGADKALSAEMGKFLGGVIGYDGKTVDLSQLTEQNCSLGPSAWYHTVDGGGKGKHKAIPVTPGERLRVKMVSYNGNTSGNYTGWYIFVTSSYNPPYSSGQSVPSCGADTRLPAAVGVSVPLVAPNDAAYLIITTNDGSGVSPVWQVNRMATPDENILESISRLDEDISTLDEVVGGTPTTSVSEWNGPQLSDQQEIKRAYYIATAKAFKNGVITVKLSDYSTYKIGVVIQDGTSYTSQTISDTGWKTTDIVKTISASEAGYRVRVTIGKVNDTSITTAEAESVLSELTYSYLAGTGGLVSRVEALEEAGEHNVDRIPIVKLGTAVYVGKKVGVAEHEYTHIQLGTLTSQSTSRQGGAVYGDYLFQCHDTNNAVVVFKISTGQSIQTISLTANSSNHANAASFGGQYYNQSDPFPCLYISSEGESKTYVYRITGTEGSFSLTLVQTLSYIVPYYYPNLHVDAPNNRGVIVGYKINSWQSAMDNKMMCCSVDLPGVGEGNKTLTVFYNEFSFPFIYATQSAVARYGKLYHSFGNTSGDTIGGIVIVDYILHNVETFIDLKACGNIEPEGFGIYDGGFIVSTQDGAVLQISF